MKLLEYENQIFLDLFHEDGLLVTAKGLGIERVFLNFLKVYSDPANLVLVLNTSSLEEDYLLEHLEGDNVKPLPRVITNECNASDRQNIYLNGGVLFITSRILVVDLLTDRVPVENVSGILVYRAHRIVESCQEAFILRLYRQKNKTGFIKAFSDSPHSFTSGFCHVERTMRSLFVRKLYLWPRFHASVVTCLEQHKVDVVEIHVRLTTPMLACQTALLDLINACIQELKRCTTAIDTEEITAENAIGKSFDKVIRLQLDPIWHQLGPKTRQLVSDLKTLRLILSHLTQYDCVTFFNMVNSVRSSEREFGRNTGWLFLDSADSLFVHAKERVYGCDEKIKKSKQDKGAPQTKPNTEKQAEEDKEPPLEGCPKWEALSAILKEIEDDDPASDRLDQRKVLVVANDDRTCSQLRQYLTEGCRSLLVHLYNKSLAARGQHLVNKTRFRPRFNEKKKETTLETADKDRVSELTLTQMVGSKNEKDEKAVDAGPTGRAVDGYYGVLSAPVTILHPLHGCSDPHGLARVLVEIQPQYVVLYDVDMMFVRQLEVHRASHAGRPLRVYFLMYTGSVEEQKYLTTLRQEKEAFEFLIREKATMVIPEERDGKLEDDPYLSRDITPANATVNSRKGGQSERTRQQKVIVDMREFRSELPSLIHRRGIEIEPVTLEVGDYILTPDICVERKSVSDLIGSLANGRLYNQCVSMCRYYKRPVLLIEFDPKKSFSLQGKYNLSNEVSMQDVTSQIALLTIHFPKLRILWCQSPYATAELVEELKVNRLQPDAAKAMTVTAAEDAMEWSDKYSPGPQDMLLKMPGINSKNYRLVMNHVHSLSDLCTQTEDQLASVLGNKSNAKKLWQFLHLEHKQIEKKGPENDKTSKTDGSSKIGKGAMRKGFKRKK
ncbi:hypothetical protein ScPMuIL_000355 [Solemya velum]